MVTMNWFKDVFKGTKLGAIFESKKKLSDERKIYKKIDEQLVFVESQPLTLGVEFELGILDKETLRPVHLGPKIINEINSPQVKKEGFEHMVEVTTVIAKSVHEVETQINQALDKLVPACEKYNAVLTGTGRPPTIMLSEARRVADERYGRLDNERQVLGKRFGTLGMHIHIGMTNAEQCVRFHNFFMHFVPHLIALSASSPFEDGVDTGLASIRPTIAESLPVAGMPYSFHNWQEYVNLVRAIYRAGSIQHMKDLWWDLRPAPRFGTLELRVCDQPASLAEGLTITTFVHGLALWFKENQDWLEEIPRPHAWRLRENKWRAMRYGLHTDLVLNNQGATRPLIEDIEIWIERFRPFVEHYNYHPYIATLENILEKGNSAARQQRLWAATGNLDTIAKFNCDEFAAKTPLWEEVEKAEAKKKHSDDKSHTSTREKVVAN